MSKKISELTTKINSYEVTDPDRQVSAEEYNTILTTVQQHERNFVREDGNYPKMSVGFADNLIGRGEATEEEFTYRPTNGKNSIEDGVARVTKIKGNSVVWNQLFTPIVNTFTKQGLTFIIDETGKVRITGTSTSQAGIAIGRANIVSGRKYLYIGIPKDINGRWWWSDQTPAYDFGSGVITTPTYPDENRYFVIHVTEGTTVDITFYPKVCDLTKMFTAGNEPSTIEEFYARIPSGIDINAYNEGEIIHMNTEAIKAVGFNQWDEQWELGIYDTDNGKPYTTSTNIRCKDAIKVLKNTTYYGRVPIKDNVYLKVLFYDEQDNYIGFANSANESFTTPVGCCFLRFFASAEYGTKYNNDICINLSHTGWKNGTYEPYREFTREIPVIKKYFPDGMKKAGNAFDSIEWDSSKQKWVAVQRIVGIKVSDYLHKSYDGVFTLINLPYSHATETKGTYSLNVLTVGFDADTRAWDAQSNGAPSVCAAQNRIWLNGDILLKYATAEEYANVLGDTLLYYAIAEPIVMEIEDDYLNFDYDAEDFGTEEALSSVPSAPFSADIIYKFNAVDSIRQNRLDINALQELVLSLQSQIASIQTQETSTLIE